MATRVPDPDALAIIRKGASRIVQVSDDEIAAAIRVYWTDTHNLAEGAGAAPLAAALQEKTKNRGKRVGLILSGGNIDFDLFQRWVGSGGRCDTETTGAGVMTVAGEPSWPDLFRPSTSSLRLEMLRTWMPGTSPGMTNERLLRT